MSRQTGKQFSAVGTTDNGPDAQIAASLGAICTSLQLHTGHDFSGYKEGTLLRRIRRRIQLQPPISVADYVKRLESDAGEAAALLKDLLIGVTQFFRDREAFQAVARGILPQMMEGRSTPIRVWVPGCASGEEAYSLAILLREQLDRTGTRVQIFATDLDAKMLAEARQGRYAADIAEQVSPERLDRFFVREGHGYQATSELREMCLFSEHSLIRDPPFAQLDLISCRNVLIYLDAKLQKDLIDLFHLALGPGGFLFLGPSESIVGSTDLFETVDGKNRLFRRKETATGPQVEFPLGQSSSVQPGTGSSPPPPSTRPAAPPAKDRVGSACASALPSLQVDREVDRPTVEHLQDELRATRAELGATVEELEATNEELKSANEELVSTNEELHASNEELATVNTVLHLKVEELAYVASFPEHNPNPIIEADMDCRVRYINPTATKLFPDLVARGSAHPWLADWPAAARRLRETPGEDASSRAVVVGERTYHQELYLVDADKSVMRSYGLDITKRTRAAETLRASEERFRTLSDNAQDSIARFDREGRYLYVNPFITRALGLTAEAIVGKTPEELGRNVGVENWEARLRDVFESGQPLRFDRRSVDGRWYDAHLIPEFRGNQVETVLVSSRDITDRKRAEEALRQSEDLLSFSLATARTGAWDLDLVEHSARRSRQHDQIFGYHKLLPQWTYEMFIEHVIPEDRESVDRQFRQAIATQGDWSFECRILHHDGATRWIWAAGRHREDESGQVRRMAGIVQDITERKRAETALIAAHNRTSTILASIADAFYSLDDQWRFVTVNPAAERAPFGRPASELIGKVIWDVFPKIPGTRIHQHYLDAVAKQSHEHYEAQSPLNGRWYEVFMFPRPGGLDVYMRDIDDRKRLERLYAVLSQVNEAIVRTPGVEPLFREVCRIVAEQGDFPLAWIGLAEGRSVRPVASGGPEQSYLAEIEVEVDGELGAGPTGTSIRENRPVVNNDFATNPSTTPWRPSALGHRFRASAAFPLRKNGTAIGALTLYANRLDVFDAKELRLIEALCADLSYAMAALEHERQRTEMEHALRTANAQLIDADQHKNEFLAMLSHELRNPLTPIRNSLYILEHAAPSTDQGKHALDVLGRQTIQLVRLVDDLLDVTRISRNKIQLQRSPLDFNEVVRRALEDHRSLFA
ncbi:MAG TPA: CheR family methyltransferase, partial [Polyangia bacterium]